MNFNKLRRAFAARINLFLSEKAKIYAERLTALSARRLYRANLHIAAHRKERRYGGKRDA